MGHFHHYQRKQCLVGMASGRMAINGEWSGWLHGPSGSARLRGWESTSFASDKTTASLFGRIIHKNNVVCNWTLSYGGNVNISHCYGEQENK